MFYFGTTSASWGEFFGHTFFRKQQPTARRTQRWNSNLKHNIKKSQIYSFHRSVTTRPCTWLTTGFLHKTELGTWPKRFHDILQFWRNYSVTDRLKTVIIVVIYCLFKVKLPYFAGFWGEANDKQQLFREQLPHSEKHRLRYMLRDTFGSCWLVVAGRQCGRGQAWALRPWWRRPSCRSGSREPWPWPSRRSAAWRETRQGRRQGKKQHL